MLESESVGLEGLEDSADSEGSEGYEEGSEEVLGRVF